MTPRKLGALLLRVAALALAVAWIMTIGWIIESRTLFALFVGIVVQAALLGGFGALDYVADTVEAHGDDCE